MAVAAKHGVGMGRYIVVAVGVAVTAVADVCFGIDTFVTAGGQNCITFDFALAERAHLIAVFAIHAFEAAAGVGVGNAFVGGKMIIVGTGRDLAFAFDAIACAPSGNGLCAVDLGCAAMFGVVGNADAFFRVHIFDACQGLTGAVLTNAGFPAGLCHGAVVVVASAMLKRIVFAAIAENVLIGLARQVIRFIYTFALIRIKCFICRFAHGLCDGALCLCSRVDALAFIFVERFSVFVTICLCFGAVF